MFFLILELIEEKRQGVKEEVDALIAQWQNVNVDELLGNTVEKLPESDVSQGPNQSNLEKDMWNDNLHTDSSVKQNKSSVNGSWSMKDSLQTWMTEETPELYSAKEQRIKRKLTGMHYVIVFRSFIRCFQLKSRLLDFKIELFAHLEYL